MKRLQIAFLTVAVSLGVLLVMVCVIAGRSTPTMAAPRLDPASSDLFAGSYLPLYQIQCTLSTTTTDSLRSSNNNDSARAVALADYTGLALLTTNGYPEQTISTEPDWFRLDNAEIGTTYEVEAIPDLTSNYNLGIIVYDSDLTPIITDTNTADFRAKVTLVADNYGPYFFKVFQVSSQCSGGTYHLNFSATALTATPTSTPQPGADSYEPNNTMGTAYVFPVATSASATNANFVPSASDVDWFAFYVKSGRDYRASTTDLSGVDTYLEVYNKDGGLVTYDNDGGGGFASRAGWEASYDGYYYIKISNLVGTSGSGSTYDLTLEEISASATSTPGPAPTNPSADRCDKTNLGNHDFDNACVISVNVSERLNFSPPPFGGPDNDFFKLWVKPGLLYECSTSDLSAGVDPNMIVYNSDENALGGNDDVEPGNFNSHFAFYATYEGWMYLLVGTGDRTPPSLSDSYYTLLCTMQVPGQATATPGPTQTPVGEATPTRTPGGPPPTSTPLPPTATPNESLTVRPLTTPTPVPVTTPAPRFVPIRLLVYYDGNDDQQPGAGEGVAGVSVQFYEVATNQLLTQGFTDEQGNLESSVRVQGPVRVSVPFFGFSQLVAGEGASIYLRVPPQPLSEGTP
jgi:hypothetical protein